MCLVWEKKFELMLKFYKFLIRCGCYVWFYSLCYYIFGKVIEYCICIILLIS